ncbi:MAG: acyltransferase [Pseudomonadota bacterium]
MATITPKPACPAPTPHPGAGEPAGSVGTPRAQLNALTGLRGLAAWFVVFYHIRLSLTDLLPTGVIDVFARGYLAVDFFFLLSGFVMWLNYGERFAQDGARQALPFLWKRFARVWPLHALMLSGFVVFVALLAATGRPIEGYPLHELPLHVLLMQNWGLTSELTWNHPAWSISTEFAAYLLFPVLVMAVPWQRLGPAVLLAVLLALLGGLGAVFATMDETSLGADIARTGLLRCVLEFAAGLVLARLWQSAERIAVGPPLWALGGLGLALAGIALGLPETLFVPASFAAILMACALDTGPLAKALSAPIMLWIGETSYATYLMHFFAFILFKIAFVGPDLQMGWMGLIGFCLAVQAGAAILYVGFEKPAQRWLNSRQPRAPRVA